MRVFLALRGSFLRIQKACTKRTYYYFEFSIAPTLFLKISFVSETFKHIFDKRLFPVFVIDTSPQKSSVADNPENHGSLILKMVLTHMHYCNYSTLPQRNLELFSINSFRGLNDFIVGKILINKFLSFVLYRGKNRNVRWKIRDTKILIYVYSTNL